MLLAQRYGFLPVALGNAVLQVFVGRWQKQLRFNRNEELTNSVE